MTKVLHVWGNDDYGALTFEQSKMTAKEAWKESWEAKTYIVFIDEEGEDESFNCKALLFEDIDPEFIKFIRSIQDYDGTKRENFYIVKEEGE